MILNRSFVFLLKMVLAIYFGASANISYAENFRLNAHAVVELFTSQGCASCPLADKVLANIAKDKNIITLAYHVDYWDYNGWRDSFGSKANSKLQAAYSKAQNTPNVYTPQMIINGEKDIVGSHGEKVKAAVVDSNFFVPIDIKTNDDYLTITIDGNEKYAEATVLLVTFISSKEVKVSRGENAGKRLQYTNIVTQRRALGMWQPKTGAIIKLPIDEILTDDNDGLAIIVQNHINGLPSKIIASAAYTH
jgi:hypothetical protein